MLFRFLKLKQIVNDVTSNADDIPHLTVIFFCFCNFFNIYRILLLFCKKNQKEELNSLRFSSEDWKFTTVLVNLLKPFYASTNFLQTQEYHTLSSSTFIENILFKHYESKISDDEIHLYLFIAIRDI